MADILCWTCGENVLDKGSSYTKQNKGNLEEGGNAETLQLYAGQHSEKDNDMCDVDEVNVQQSHWYLWYWRNSSSWVKIYSWNLDCYTWNIHDHGNVVRCAATWIHPDGSTTHDIAMSIAMPCVAIQVPGVNLHP